MKIYREYYCLVYCPIFPCFVRSVGPSYFRTFVRSVVRSFLPSSPRSFRRSIIPSSLRSFCSFVSSFPDSLFVPSLAGSVSHSERLHFDVYLQFYNHSINIFPLRAFKLNLFPHTDVDDTRTHGHADDVDVLKKNDPHDPISSNFSLCRFHSFPRSVSDPAPQYFRYQWQYPPKTSFNTSSCRLVGR